GVSYVDRVTRTDKRAQARIVVLAASACETARIMLNSKSALWPNGIANSSGLVGRYLMDTVGASVAGQIPALESLPPQNEDGAGGDHCYMPWWLYGAQQKRQLDFARGYHVEFNGGRQAPDAGIFSGLEQLTNGSYGRQFKADARRYYGSFLDFDG